MKKVFSVILILLLSAGLAACSAGNSTEFTPEALAVLSDFDKLATVDGDAVKITLSDEGITVNDEGASAEGATVTITGAGTYSLSGTLSNGRILVKAEKTAKIRLILNGVWISSNETAPLWVESADKVVVTLAEGTSNTLSDVTRPPIGTDPESEEENANACIYAEDDLTINGNGTLNIEAGYNGIGGKNDIRICGGTYAISAANNGIKGKDSVIIAAGVLNVTAGKDGIKSDNAEEAGRGYVQICGGNTTVTAMDDGIQAATKLTIEAGTVTVKAEDDAVNCDGETNIKDGCLTDLKATAQP